MAKRQFVIKRGRAAVARAKYLDRSLVKVRIVVRKSQTKT